MYTVASLLTLNFASSPVAFLELQAVLMPSLPLSTDGRLSIVKSLSPKGFVIDWSYCMPQASAFSLSIMMRSFTSLPFIGRFIGSITHFWQS